MAVEVLKLFPFFRDIIAPDSKSDQSPFPASWPLDKKHPRLLQLGRYGGACSDNRAIDS
jgi:hypothetical protein